MSTPTRWTVAAGLTVFLAGCAPARFGIPGPSLPWWPVATIMGATFIYAAIRSRK